MHSSLLKGNKNDLYYLAYCTPSCFCKFLAMHVKMDLLIMRAPLQEILRTINPFSALPLLAIMNCLKQADNTMFIPV